MINPARVSLVITATLAAIAIGAVVFVGSGIYNIGADDHHTKIVSAIIEQLRERSIAVRARATRGGDQYPRITLSRITGDT